MVRRRAHVLVALAAATLWTATAAGSANAGQSSHRAGERAASSTTPLVYLLAGTNSAYGGVYAWHLGQRHARLVTPPNVGFDWLAGRGHTLVLGEFTADKPIDLMRGTTLTPVKVNGHRIAGVTPTLAPNGSLGYTTLVYPSKGAYDPSAFDIVVRTARGTGPRTVVYRQPTYQPTQPYVVGPSWNSTGDQIAFTRTDEGAGHTKLVVIDRAKKTRHVLSVPITRGGPPSWSPTTPWVTVGHNRAGFFINTATGQMKRMAAGWMPMCWNPTSTAVLAMHNGTLALIRRATPTHVKHIASLAGQNFFGCYWPPTR